MAYPSILSVISNPNAGDRLNSPSHSSIHQAENTAITEIETFVGTLASTAGTLVYDIRSSNSNGGGHVQTANKGGTGQTTFNTGDLLVAQSSSVLTKLAIGTIPGQALVVDNTQSLGVKWGVPNSNPTIRVYSNPSVLTWSKPSNLSYIVVEVIGAGEGGGLRTPAGGIGGTGGDSGGYGIKVIPASLLGVTETIRVASGTVGATINGPAPRPSVTSFGTTSFLSADTQGASGDFFILPFNGGVGGALGATGGGGADTPMGFGKGPVSSTFGGRDSVQGYGTGGRGSDNAGTPGVAGNGLVIVREY